MILGKEKRNVSNINNRKITLLIIFAAMGSIITGATLLASHDLAEVAASLDDRRPTLAVNNTYGKLRAVNSGLGLASLPDFVAAENTSLVRVLPELSGPPNEAYFVYPEELRSSKRISVFRDFLLRKVAEGRLS